LAAGTGTLTIETLEHDDGIVHHSVVSKFPIPGPDGGAALIGGVAIDITDRLQAEQTLRESEERLRGIVENSPGSVQLVAADGTLLDMNPAGLAMVEAAGGEEVVGKCVYDLIAPEHREAFRAFNERVCRGEGGSLEFDLVGLRGTRRHMEAHAAPLRAGG